MSGFKISEPDGSVYDHEAAKTSNLHAMEAEYENCKAKIADLIQSRSDQIYKHYVQVAESKEQVSLKRQKKRRLEAERRRVELDHQIAREQQRAVELETVLGVTRWICAKQEVTNWFDAAAKHAAEKKRASQKD